MSLHVPILCRLSSNAALIRLADMLSKHIADQGTALIEQQVQVQNQSSTEEGKEGGPAKKSSTSDLDDPIFMQKIIALHDKYANVIKQHFNSNIQFQKALKDAFVSCMNMDVVSKAQPAIKFRMIFLRYLVRLQGKFKFADLLATYSDRLLRTGGSGTGAAVSSAGAPTSAMSDQEIESQLENVVGLFTYLVDKDLFSEIYRNLLSKRLLTQKSASDEMERVMVGKLKLKCGNNFTSKLEGKFESFTNAIE